MVVHEDVIWSAHNELEFASNVGARYMTNRSATLTSRTPPKAPYSAVVEAAAAATAIDVVRAATTSTLAQFARSAVQAAVKRPDGPRSNMLASAGASCPRPKRPMVTWSDDWSVCAEETATS